MLISVSDQGIGIPPGEAERLFEPFRRGGLSREAIPGVGLGLHVARRIVEAQGGRITVESAAGAGSTFTVWLPRLRPIQRPPSRDRSPAARPEA